MTETLKTLGRALDLRLSGIGAAFKAFVGAGILAGLLRVVLDVASRIHPAFATVLATAMAVLVVWLTHALKASHRLQPATEAFSVLFFNLLAMAVIGSWASYTLMTLGWAQYQMPQRWSLGTFMDMYVLTFLDLIPGLRFSETLSISSPIRPTDALAGLPILGFKVFVVWLFFDAFRSWRKRVVAAKPPGQAA